MSLARVSTELEAANLALAEIGEPPVASLDAGNARARALRQHFGTALDEALAEKPWGFATAWDQPAAATTPGRGALRTRFPLPTDCVAVRFIAGDDGEPSTEEWDIEAATVAAGDMPAEAKVLVTNMAAPRVCYTRRVTVPRLWDATFVRVFAKRLAARIAPQLGRGLATAAALDDAADQVRDRAAAIDAREESRSQVTRDTSWVSVRRGWRRRRGW